MSEQAWPPLAQPQFDRAAARRSDDEWLAGAWPQARIVVVSASSATPVDTANRIVFRDVATAPEGPRRFLGVVGDIPYFTVVAEPDGDGWKTPREFGAQSDDLEASLVISAVALEQWHQRHGHCPRCGARTVETQAGWTRTCTRDASVHFPRTDPAVIMLIHDGEGDTARALLGRGQQWAPGRFSTLAGFVEPGESLEAAVAREVYEEVGVGVRDVRYRGSQPWPFPASLMVGFAARLAGDPSLTPDLTEVAEAGWFTRDEVRAAADWTDEHRSPELDRPLRGIPPHFSISRFLIDRWLAGDA